MISLEKIDSPDINKQDMIGNSLNSDEIHSEYALQVAFKTMKERCQHLQVRLAAVEEENVRLRLECNVAVKDEGYCTENEILELRRKVRELTKEKSQLNHHIFMVAAENRQLWNKLTALTRANKSLENQLFKISNTLKKHPSTKPIDVLTYTFEDTSYPEKSNPNLCLLSTETGNKDQSLEEISLRLKNSMILEKSELEKQYAEMVELQNSSELNFQNFGLTYPEETYTDSLEQLKHHDIRLSQMRDALLSQQMRLKKIPEKLRALKKGIFCDTCQRNTKKKLCQIGTQIDLDFVRENHTIPSNSSSNSPKTQLLNNDNSDCDNICPLCGTVYNNSMTFTAFHEHVMKHFGNEDSDN